jgi:cytochrome c peroxidase
MRQMTRLSIAIALVAEAGALSTSVASRRAILRSGATFAAGSTLSPLLPAFAAAPKVDYAGAQAALQGLIDKDPDIGPTMVRLAWHSSGTYDKMTKTGGSGAGTIRFKEELAHGGNAGLDMMVAKLEPIRAQFPDISYADLYVLAGATALKAAGVPVPFKSGRVDAMSPDAVTPDGRLPDASKGNDPQKTASALRKDVFYRMGFNDKEIVALSGAHALGRCHPDASGCERTPESLPESLPGARPESLPGASPPPPLAERPSYRANPSPSADPHADPGPSRADPSPRPL